MSVVFSVGKWGGFYVFFGYTKRVCLGWFAITFFPRDIDEIFNQCLEKAAK